MAITPPITYTPQDEELLSLFLVALHGFDSKTLELKQDSAICLSFEKNDVVYVHSVDSSGWGEVTLIKTLKRGWVPVNFFQNFIEPNEKQKESDKLFLKRLLISSAKFFSNPFDNPNNGGAIFSIHHINDIRDGVKELLEMTNCLSRSTEIVKKKPVIRKVRKSLLADWYSLMIKADSYKHSRQLPHLETLNLMLFQILKKSITFTEIWLLENEALKKQMYYENLEKISREKEEKIESEERDRLVLRRGSIPNLKTLPFAKERLNEVYTLLFTYIGFILGRLDMIEHNPYGCQILETLTHQMILLLRELLFISKSCIAIIHDRGTQTEARNDDNIDTLLSLVSELVSGVKVFVAKFNHNNYSRESFKIKDALYYYTVEGDELIGIISRMTRSIAATIESCHRYISITQDFRLSAEKNYADFKSIQWTPEYFIKMCSYGLLKTLKNEGSQLQKIPRDSISRTTRYAMVRSGTSHDCSFTTSGSYLLQEFLPDAKAFVETSIFDPFFNGSDQEYSLSNDIQDEILYDSENRLIGASFRGLVAILTDELIKPNQFFITTFFLTFKQYSSGIELIECFIERFNVTNKNDECNHSHGSGESSPYDSRLKSRRRLICAMFQIWLESYWDYSNDYNLLPTLINFFNEGVSQFLPSESKKLIELCSKLTVMTPSKIQDNQSHSQMVKSIVNSNGSKQSSDNHQSTNFKSSRIQLVNRPFNSGKHHQSSLSHSSSLYSMSSFNKELDNDDYIFEEYELAKVSSNHRNSLLIPLPSMNFNIHSLLSKSQIQEIEQLVLNYRRALGKSIWVHGAYSHFYPVELQKILGRWFAICQEIIPFDMKIEYNMLELNSFEIAKQLTLIESKIFLSIKPEELMDGNFKEKKSKLNMSPNIQHSLLFTNLLTDYVLETILLENLPEKKRSSRIKSWLNIALSCYYLKNFNSLAAIITALQNYLLGKLDIVWDLLPEKYSKLFADLQKIIHPTNNYKGYRYKLSKILNDNDTQSNVPVVPYISLFIQDLTFIQDGNKDYRNSQTFSRSKIINFDKFLKISKIISNVEYLQVGYDRLPSKKQSKRNSLFNFNSTNSNAEELAPILPLQELILLELWRIHQLKLEDPDRLWTLSKKLKVKT